MLVQPTELSYLSEVSNTNSQKSKYSIFSQNSKLTSSTRVDENYYNKKVKGNMVNNIFREIDARKQKDIQEKVNYIELLKVSEQDYNQAQVDINNIVDSIFEDHIIEIQSINIPSNLQKRLFEFFSYLLGDPYFVFKGFKESLNLYELKYKMTTLEYEKIENKRVNFMLDLIANNEKMTLENLENELPVIELIFQWIQNILKIYIYKVQNKLLNYHRRNRSMVNVNGSTRLSDKSKASIDESKISSFKNPSEMKKAESYQPMVIRSSRYADQELEGIKEVVTNSMNNTAGKTKYMGIQNILASNSQDKNSNVYLTDLKSTGVGKGPDVKGMMHNRSASDVSKVRTSSDLAPIKNVKVNNWNVELEGFDIGIEKRKSLIKTLESVAFIKHKTFHQLRKHFGLLIPSSKAVSSSHVDEIWGSSLQNPKNIKLILSRFSNGHIKGLDYETLGKLSHNLKNEEYFNGPDWYKSSSLK